MTEQVERQVPVSDLQLGDIVQCFNGEYGTGAVVEKRTDLGLTSARIIRPYVHTGDFEHSGGVSWYIGIEDFKIYGKVDRLKKGPALR